MSDFYSQFNPYNYIGVVTRVVDADTIDAEIDLGFGITTSQRFRVDSGNGDYDAPETYRPKTLSEKEHGLKATARAIELLMDKKLIFVTSKTPGVYGRYGAIIYLEDGRNFAEVMISEGFVKRDYTLEE